MPEILELMVNNYIQHPLASYLYLMEVSMSVFIVEKYEETVYNIRDKIIDSFNKLVEKTFRFFEDLKAIDENPALTEDFFGMLFRCAKYNPQILNNS